MRSYSEAFGSQPWTTAFQAGAVKLVPYALGELAHWGQDLTGQPIDRAYGQVGIRSSLPMCVERGAAPLYEPTWVGELYNWGSALDIYDKEKQELMRQAQGLYNKKGGQTTFGATTSITELLKANAHKEL